MCQLSVNDLLFGIEENTFFSLDYFIAFFEAEI